VLVAKLLADVLADVEEGEAEGGDQKERFISVLISQGVLLS
jgi:hypothetical protein